MKPKSYKYLLWYFVSPCLIVFPVTSHAYIGPGAGLSAIGALVALVATVVIAIVGFFWYPIKRLLKKRSRENQEKIDTTEGD